MSIDTDPELVSIYLTLSPSALSFIIVREMRSPATEEEQQQVPLRTFLLNGVLRFTLATAGLPGVDRIALIGSLTTSKISPKDADVLVTVAADCSLDRLAKAGRALKGYAQTRNSGADIFLANPKGQYIGRVCHWRECRPGMRLACQAQQCGRREFLSEDLQVVDLPLTLVAAPPIEIWPIVVTRVTVPADVEQILLRPLQASR